MVCVFGIICQLELIPKLYIYINISISLIIKDDVAMGLFCSRIAIVAYTIYACV